MAVAAISGFYMKTSRHRRSGTSQDVRRHFSGVTGRVAVLTAEGSSRNLRYKPVSPGCGTLSVASRKPAGTGAGWVNCGSDATESIKYKMAPLNLHGFSGFW